jgi:2Fe-2S ferredoxin
MSTITFHIGTQVTKVEGEVGKSILQIALDHGIPMEHACGGNGFCTTCLCRVRKGSDLLVPRTDREDNMGVIADPERLGCQAVVEREGEIEVEIEG